MAELEFDANNVEPQGSFEPLPAGNYLSMMVDSEWKDTKSGSGKYLQIDWEVIDGDHKGRRLFERLNLKNSNDTAVKIANGTLSAICHAVGVLQLKDSAQLHGKPCVVKVKIEERNDRPGEMTNRISGYESSNAASAPAPAAAAPGAKPPWKK